MTEKKNEEAYHAFHRTKNLIDFDKAIKRNLTKQREFQEAQII